MKTINTLVEERINSVLLEQSLFPKVIKGDEQQKNTFFNRAASFLSTHFSNRFEDSPDRYTFSITSKNRNIFSLVYTPEHWICILTRTGKNPKDLPQDPEIIASIVKFDEKERRFTDSALIAALLKLYNAIQGDGGLPL